VEAIRGHYIALGGFIPRIEFVAIHDEFDVGAVLLTEDQIFIKNGAHVVLLELEIYADYPVLMSRLTAGNRTRRGA
jgi:hypothetical protein